ncbi:MAG: amidohydrolase family protein [Phycisphaeraceae bacterium]|nr:amidohydrolase family protein [Phycisphaeraceae bacterium]
MTDIDLPADLPRIDAHHHLWAFDRYDYGWIEEGKGVLGRDYGLDDLEEATDSAGVTATVLVQTFSSLDESKWFLDLAQQSDRIAGVVAWVDLKSEDVGAQLDQLIDHGGPLVGIRHVVQAEVADWLLRDDVSRGLDAVAERELTYDLLLLPEHLEHAPDVARRHPDLPMVIDHIAKPPIRDGGFDGWDESMKAAAECPNVTCKLSGLVTEANRPDGSVADLAPYVHHTIDCFGYDRLMFGTDWPVCLLVCEYDEVLEHLVDVLPPMSRPEQEQLFYATARDFYGLAI